MKFYSHDAPGLPKGCLSQDPTRVRLHVTTSHSFTDLEYKDCDMKPITCFSCPSSTRFLHFFICRSTSLDKKDYKAFLTQPGNGSCGSLNSYMHRVWRSPKFILHISIALDHYVSILCYVQVSEITAHHLRVRCGVYVCVCV